MSKYHSETNNKEVKEVKPSYTFGDLVEDYLDIKDQINQLEAKAESYKTKIHNYLKMNNRTSIACPTFKIEQKTITSKRFLKEKCPPEIWEKYSSETTHRSLYINRLSNGKVVRNRVKTLEEE